MGRVIVATPGGLPTLSGFSDVIRAGWTIVRRFSDEVPLRLRPKALSSYKVKLVNCITLLSDRALAVLPKSALRIPAEVPGPPPRRESGPTCGRSLNCTPPASGKPNKLPDHMTRGGVEDH